MNRKVFDLRTPNQRAKDERNKKIVEMYDSMVKVLPEDTSKWSMYRAIGEEFGMQPQGIRMVIEKNLKNIAK